MPWKISKQFRFEAAHRLPHHDGKCARLHGHSFVGWVVLRGETLARSGPKQGMLVDYADIRERIQPLVAAHLDHHYLNESTGLENPTSEELARWIYDQLEPLFHGQLDAIVIEETCTSRAEYSAPAAAHLEKQR